MAPGHTSFADPGMVYRCGGHKIVTIEETIDTLISRLATYGKPFPKSSRFAMSVSRHVSLTTARGLPRVILSHVLTEPQTSPSASTVPETCTKLLATLTRTTLGRTTKHGRRISRRSLRLLERSYERSTSRRRQPSERHTEQTIAATELQKVICNKDSQSKPEDEMENTCAAIVAVKHVFE